MKRQRKERKIKLLTLAQIKKNGNMLRRSYHELFYELQGLLELAENNDNIKSNDEYEVFDSLENGFDMNTYHSLTGIDMVDKLYESVISLRTQILEDKKKPKVIKKKR